MNLKNILLVGLISNTVLSLPIDWKGSFYVDTTSLNNVRATRSACPTPAASEDSYCVEGTTKAANFQTMNIRLNPEMVINDSATLKGELNLGDRSHYLGEGTQANGSDSFFSSQTQQNSLNVSRLYLELFADTALFRIGKFSQHFGLGALKNNGNNASDRFQSIAQGIEAEFKVGNFSLIPSWSKVSSDTATNVEQNVTKESSIEASYSSDIRGIDVGILYLKRNQSGDEIKALDIYAKKTWDKLSVAFEAPMLSGSMKDLYSFGQAQDLDGKAYLLEASYELNSKWSFDLNIGSVSGASNDNNYSAVYLHPSFKVSSIMFNYNRASFVNPSASQHAALAGSVHNANYIGLNTHYKTMNWHWSLSYFMAKANETATSGERFFNHQSKKYSTVAASADQSDDLGSELTLSFKYQWNPQIYVGGHLGYFFVGDFYGFNNTASETPLESVGSTGLSLNVSY